MKLLKKYWILMIVLILIPIFSFLIGYWQRLQTVKVGAESSIFTDNLPTWNADYLSSFNGENVNMPIYIGLNGMVYDVSSGRKFYDANGAYHYLAGKDSSSDLNLIGGDIIAKKYPLVAKLAN